MGAARAARTFRGIWKTSPAALLRTSEVSGIRALPEEMERCQETGAFTLPDELEVCQISHKRVLPRLLATCPDTGRRFLQRYGTCCAQSSVIVHPDALAASDASGLVARACLLIQSEVSERRALPEELETCSESGKRVLPLELAQCRLSGVKVLPAFLSQCAICARDTITSRHLQCKGCSGRYCMGGVLEGLCRTCQELRQLPLQLLDSLDTMLQEVISKAFPAASRVAVSRNNQWILAYVERKKLLVLREKRLLIFRALGNGYALVEENHDFTIQ